MLLVFRKKLWKEQKNWVINLLDIKSWYGIWHCQNGFVLTVADANWSIMSSKFVIWIYSHSTGWPCKLIVDSQCKDG